MSQQKTLTREQVIDRLKGMQGDKSLRQFAIALNISAAYLSDIYNGNRAIGRKVCVQLGLSKRREFITTYLEATNGRRKNGKA